MTVTSVPTGARHVRRAWLSLALLPVAFVGAFAGGEGLVTLLGAEPHGDEVASRRSSGPSSRPGSC